MSSTTINIVLVVMALAFIGGLILLGRSSKARRDD